MSDWYSFEQILGYIASAILITGYAIKSDIKTKWVLIVSSVVFVFHFYLIGAVTAAAICAVNAVRNGMSIFYYGSKVLCFVFVSFYLASGYWTYQVFIDLLPLTAATLTCIGMFFFNGIKFRSLVVVATILWVIHNVIAGSIGGTITSVILFFVSLNTVISLMRKKENNAVWSKL